LLTNEQDAANSRYDSIIAPIIPATQARLSNSKSGSKRKAMEDNPAFDFTQLIVLTINRQILGYPFNKFHGALKQFDGYIDITDAKKSTLLPVDVELNVQYPLIIEWKYYDRTTNSIYGSYTYSTFYNLTGETRYMNYISLNINTKQAMIMQYDVNNKSSWVAVNIKLYEPPKVDYNALNRKMYERNARKCVDY
jgi:hypothetical protein